MGCFHKLFISVWFLAILQTADGADTFTWYEPPPVETTADTTLIRTNSTQFLQGSTNVTLSWNFSLGADLNPLVGVELRLNKVLVVQIFSGQVNVQEGFKHRFSANWINSQRVTLVIFNATVDDNGTFVCQVSTFGEGLKVWSRKIQVTVLVPSHNAHISGNQTVNETDIVTLFCNASGNPTPTITWTRLSDNSSVSMPLNITRQDQGWYRCTADNGVGSPVTKETFITVQYQPNITNFSRNTTVNQSDVVPLSCIADGNPEPKITWTRVSDNSVVNFPLTITGKQDEGDYRCTAENGIGNPASEDVFIHVQNYRPINTNLGTPDLTNNTVVVNTRFNLTCSSQANPPAKFRFYKGQESLFNTTVGSNLAVNTTLVSERIKQVTYSCTPFNDYGDGPTDTVTVKVLFNPDTVTLERNTTENEDCSKPMWVNFTCNASDANPEVANYQLLESGGNTSVSNRGTWIKEITKGGKHVYSCLAEHPVENVTSANTVTLTLNVLGQISLNVAYGSETPVEDGDVFLCCSATGFPHPTITWRKDGVVVPDERTSWLNFTNINRSASGSYICHANNSCGNRSSLARRIDVLYKPENVTLNTSSSSVCVGSVVNFTCTADANPPVDTYRLLYKNDQLIENLDGSGVTTKILNTSGRFNYTCEARNSVGNDTSSNKVVTVEVPVQISLNVAYGDVTLTEGEDVYLYCDATGSPPLAIAWTKDGDVVPDERTPWLNLTYINKTDTGNYACRASNLCGPESSLKKRVNVTYKPENVTLSTSSSNVCKGSVVTFTCTADANPPVRTYRLLYKNGSVIENLDGSGVTTKALNTSGQFNYKCDAINSVGNDTSNNTVLTVEVPASVISAENKTVNEGDNVTLFCNVSGVPSPNVSWIRVSDNRMKVGAMWQLPGISKSNGGKYKCIASNRCGNDSKTAFIDVQYPPSAKVENLTRCNDWFVNIPCVVDGNPEPVVTWYKGTDTNVALPESGEVFTANESGCYTCYAKNSLGNATDTSCVTAVVIITAIPLSGFTVKNKECKNFPNEELDEKFKIILQPVGQECTEFQKCTNGSAIIDLVLRFSQSVNATYVIYVLKKAAEEGKFGNLDVDPASIKLTSQPSTASPSPTGTGTRGTQVPVCEETFLKNADCSTIVWKIVVLAVAGVALIVIVAVIIAWWVHKKRKCRKDPRIHNSEERLHGNAEDNAYSQVNHGYAGTGPRPNGTEAVALQQRAAADGSDAAAHQQEAAAIPTYAEVDKSKKKKKAEEKLDYTYAEVDKSKKSKKKPKSGEMIYADLEDINVPRPMPTVSTSPQPLPPIKRPEPYENTQYADITQFLKGEATLPQSDSNQGTELQPQGANKDEGGAEGEDRNTPM